PRLLPDSVRFPTDEHTLPALLVRVPDQPRRYSPETNWPPPCLGTRHIPAGSDSESNSEGRDAPSSWCEIPARAAASDLRRKPDQASAKSTRYPGSAVLY